MGARQRYEPLAEHRLGGKQGTPASRGAALSTERWVEPIRQRLRIGIGDLHSSAPEEGPELSGPALRLAE